MAKNLIEQHHLTDLGVDEGEVKWFLRIFGEMMRIGFVWLRIKCNGELLCYIKFSEFFDQQSDC